MYGRGIHLTVCTGATVNIMDDGIERKNLKAENARLKDDLGYAERQLANLREASFQATLGGETYQAALLNVRLKLDQLGCAVEASEEYDFIQSVDKIVTEAGFPRRQLPAVPTQLDQIFADDEIPF